MTTRTGVRLEALLTDLLRSPVATVDVRRSRYSTSFPIDDLTVTLASGETLTIVRKHLAWSALLPEARAGKPSFLFDVRREIGAYRRLLPDAPAGTPRYFGDIESDDGGRWLFMERVDGVELFQVGDVPRWEATARWVARLHRTFRDRFAELRDGPVPLLVHDRRWLERWADRAQRTATPQTATALQALRRTVPALAERLAALPVTLVHGELYASNVLVGPPGAAPRVCPIDWEMVALAPPLIDIAALTTGPWPVADRRAIEAAYCSELGRPQDATFEAELDACRLALCLQWLGWSPGWRPPAEHRQDWLGEALVLAETVMR